ncbi:hypothetical protein D3C87_1351460 [compost metagenome]
MTEIGIKRFSPGHRQKDSAKNDNASKAFAQHEFHRVPGVEGLQNTQIIGDMDEPYRTHDDEPERGNRPEET